MKAPCFIPNAFDDISVMYKKGFTDGYTMKETEMRTLAQTIASFISNFTSIAPEILFKADFSSNSILVVWQGKVPDETTTSKIQDALTQFGTPIPTHYRLCNYVSFLISRTPE